MGSDGRCDESKDKEHESRRADGGRPLYTSDAKDKREELSEFPFFVQREFGCADFRKARAVDGGEYLDSCGDPPCWLCFPGQVLSLEGRTSKLKLYDGFKRMVNPSMHLQSCARQRISTVLQMGWYDLGLEGPSVLHYVAKTVESPSICDRDSDGGSRTCMTDIARSSADPLS